MQPKSSMEFYCRGDFATIKLGNKSKKPVEKWRDQVFKGRSLDEFKGLNIGVRCGLPCDDGFLVVIDVDAQHGGLETLEKLPPLPITFTVRTGNGGFHFYFTTEEPIRKQKLPGGIDIQGVGSYVVGAGSIHENGNFYEEVEDNVDFIETLPDDWLEILTKPQEDDTLDIDAERDLKPIDGERNDYLTSEGGKLRRLGYTYGEILALLTVTNKEKCKPPVGDQEVAVIAKSVSSYAPEYFREKTETIKTEALETLAREPLAPGITSNLSRIKRLDEVYNLAPGLVKSLADSILSQAPREYKQFALSTALSIFSAVGQGGFRAPSLREKKTLGSMLNLYVWNVAPASAGKDFYLRYHDRILREVDERLVCDKIGSFYGLRASLYGFNSRCLIIDEMQDEMSRLGSKASTYLNQVLTEMKELYNPRSEMSSIVIKDRTYPAIKEPKLSIFSAGTTGGFYRHLNGTIIGGGLLSRFMVVPVEEIADSLQRGDFAIPNDIVEALKKVAAVGLTRYAKEQDAEEEMRAYMSVGGAMPGRTPTKLEHEPQVKALKIIDITKEARELLEAFRREQELAFQELVRQGEGDNELSHGSIIDRSGQLAVKLAAIASLGCSPFAVISKECAVFAIELTQWLTESLVDAVKGHAALGVEDRHMQAVKRAVNKANGKAIARKDIYRLSHVPASKALPILFDLCREQSLFCFMPNQTEAVDLEGPLDDSWLKAKRLGNFFPRGVNFSSSPVLNA